MSEPRIRPERTIADLLASGEKPEPLFVYRILTDWAEQVVDVCSFIQHRVVAGQAQGRPITAAVQQHVFYMVRDILQDLRTDVDLLLKARYEHLFRRIYADDAQELVTHIDAVFSSLSQSEAPKTLAYVLDEAIVGPLIAVIDGRADIIASYEKRKIETDEALKKATDTQRQAQNEIDQALAEFSYKRRAVRAKEETLVGV